MKLKHPKITYADLYQVISGSFSVESFIIFPLFWCTSISSAGWCHYFKCEHDSSVSLKDSMPVYLCSFQCCKICTSGFVFCGCQRQDTDYSFHGSGLFTVLEVCLIIILFDMFLKIHLTCTPFHFSSLVLLQLKSLEDQPLNLFLAERYCHMLILECLHKLLHCCISLYSLSLWMSAWLRPSVFLFTGLESINKGREIARC